MNCDLDNKKKQIITRIQFYFHMEIKISDTANRQQNITMLFYPFICKVHLCMIFALKLTL